MSDRPPESYTADETAMLVTDDTGAWVWVPHVSAARFEAGEIDQATYTAETLVETAARNLRATNGLGMTLEQCRELARQALAAGHITRTPTHQPDRPSSVAGNRHDRRARAARNRKMN